jgi:hypothetical protein
MRLLSVWTVNLNLVLSSTPDNKRIDDVNQTYHVMNTKLQMHGLGLSEFVSEFALKPREFPL